MGDKIKILKKIFTFIFIIFIGFILGIMYSTSENKNTKIKNSSDIIKNILTSENISIIEEKNSCEYFDNNDTKMTKIKVRDFLEDYMKFSLYYRTKSFKEYLECGLRGKNICTFSYGAKAEWDKSWSRSLIFNYNPKSKTIDSKSFECLGLN